MTRPSCSTSAIRAIRVIRGFPLLLLLALGLAGCSTPPGAPRVIRGPGREIAPRLVLSEAAALPRQDILHQRHPAIAYGNGLYLIAWQEGFNGLGGNNRILALRLSEDGKPIDDAPIRVCAADGVRDAPAVAYCNGRFLVAWSDLRSGADYDVYAAFVTPDGKATPPDGFLLAGGPGTQAHPALASNGKDQFLAVWQGFVEDHFGIFGIRVSAVAEVLDRRPFAVMPRGEHPSVAWNGTNYLVCQKWYAANVDADGKVQGPPVQLWNSKTVGGSVAAAAWDKGFVFFDTEPYPDPWGWGGGAAIVGASLTPTGESPERGWTKAFKDLQAAEADGKVKNCLDATKWRNHPGWPMGMRGGLKGTHDDGWLSGRPAAAFNGRSLLCVWPKARLVDNRRLANRDLYLTRVLPDWGLVDSPPIRIVAGPTEEANPVLCGGAEGRALLAYEKVEDAGVGIEFRLLAEAADTRPPAVAYVVPQSDRETIVVFDEPVDPATVSSATISLDGVAVKSCVFNPDNRGRQREAILTTDPLEPGRTYVLRLAGVKDRVGNAATETREIVAKPGTFLRGDFIDRWTVLGPIPRDVGNHAIDPATAQPSPSDRATLTTGKRQWVDSKGSVQDFGEMFGEKPDLMAYAAVYIYSDRPRDALLRFDTNDHNRQWLNGELVFDDITGATGSRGFHDRTDETPVRLRQGWNRLMVQVENRFGAWLMVGQITDRDRVPLRDLTWEIKAPR